MNDFFNNAPVEVKEATVKTNAAFKRLRKAMTQTELWKKEHSFAEKEFQIAQAEQADILSRWDDHTNTVRPILENAPETKAS